MLPNLVIYIYRKCFAIMPSINIYLQLCISNLEYPGQPASCSEKTKWMLNRLGYVHKCAIIGKLKGYNLLVSNFICLNQFILIVKLDPLVEEKRPTVKIEENTMIGPA